MSTTKRKKHTDADRLKYMHMIEDGISINAIHKKYGINDNLLSSLWSKYQQYGPKSIKKGKNINVDFETKRKIIIDIKENHLTLPQASLKYGPSVGVIDTWLRIARRDGLDALGKVKKRGRPPGM